MKLLIATSNQGKIREYTHLLRGLPFEPVAPGDLGIEEKPEEKGESLKENALLKAKFYLQKADMLVISDDAGLEIDALGGEPGIYVRRWPGHEAGDQELIDYTLERLKGVPLEKRTAKFRAVMAVGKDLEDIRVFEGTMEGYIAEKPHYPVVPGYPFRSLFSLELGGKVLGEFEVEELEAVHRKRAFEQALSFLRSLV